MQKARMAKDLYEQQAAIENQVKERCAPRSLHLPVYIRLHMPFVLSVVKVVWHIV